MKQAVLSFQLLLIVFSFISCSKSSSSDAGPCGSPVTKEKYIASSQDIVFDNSQWTEDNILFVQSGNERKFMIMLKQTELCTNRVVDIGYSVTTSNSPGVTVPVNMEARADWAEGYTRALNFCKKEAGNMKINHEYKTAQSVDLHYAYGGAPGSVKAVLTVSFHTLGSTYMDTSYFHNKFKALKINIGAYRYAN